MRKAITTIIVLLCPITVSLAASIEKAVLLNQHGLTIDAKRELIDVIFQDGSTPIDQAKAYYLLGNIAFAEDKIEVALNSWSYLVEKYPKSDEAMLVDDRITELSEIVISNSKESIDNAIARSYLKNAEFWSKRDSDVFQINPVRIPQMEAALKWYNKAIAEFRNSNVARIAYNGKLHTILASKAFDLNTSFSIAEPFFDEHVSFLVETFGHFEREYPDAPTLQAFRYQIGQAYWLHHLKMFEDKYYVRMFEDKYKDKYLDLGKIWFEKVIQKAGPNDSFYRDLAQRRLENLKPR